MVRFFDYRTTLYNVSQLPRTGSVCSAWRQVNALLLLSSRFLRKGQAEATGRGTRVYCTATRYVGRFRALYRADITNLQQVLSMAVAGE
ncbi:hypothetical protein N7468_010137 [Penicillium chermesinum]|uniref:Uncharacterized protein n=1 Tax=Penicillium chermesinum TaxID=63820 RepID=A0A9W9TC86_9EURO|nr:uncharacterized protein N7468_010137 [Penicillium chermesinum]KAJ5217129.1 hypothetical protein N7468_010137 [Penicillium chermesinum]